MSCPICQVASDMHDNHLYDEAAVASVIIHKNGVFTEKIH
jgi:hypothetical protein